MVVRREGSWEHRTIASQKARILGQRPHGGRECLSLLTLMQEPESNVPGRPVIFIIPMLLAGPLQSQVSAIPPGSEKKVLRIISFLMKHHADLMLAAAISL